MLVRFFTCVLPSCCVCVLLALSSCETARAETLEFEGRILVVLPGVGEEEVASGVGVAEINGLQLESVEILTASIVGSNGIPVTDPGAAPVTSIRVQGSVRSGFLGIDPFAGPFSEPAITANTIAVHGHIRVCMLIAPLPPCIGGFSVPLTSGSGAAGVGIGGLLTVGGTATLRLSLYGSPFTLNTASVGGTTENSQVFTLFSTGSIGGPLLFTSTAGQAGGFVSMVTPTRVISGGGEGSPNIVPGFLRFEIEFLPEPGLSLLLVSGLVPLVLMGRKRARLPKTPPGWERRN